MTTSRLHVVVHGRVQGVGFRWFVQQQAREHSLAGWVRNRPDGAVELAASGPGAAVAALRRAVEQGPPGAVVTHVEERAADDAPLPAPFTILRS